MKRNHKHMWRSVVALILTFTLVFGTASTSFAAMNSGAAPNGEATGSEETVKYVSLGDSMTNGYGLDGYEFKYYWDNGWHECTERECNHTHEIWGDANGTRQVAWEAYPNMLAEKYGWDHEQLAMAGMTTDMMRWILEFPINPEDPNHDLAMEILTMDEWTFVECDDEDHTGCSDCKMNNGKSVEENWHSIWNYGDFHTFDQGPDSARMEKFCPKDVYPEMYNTLGSTNDTVAEYIALYQDEVKNADVISLCIGNGDFGNHMLNRIMWLLVGATDHELKYNMDFAIGSLTEEQQEFILDLEKELKERIVVPDVPKENSDRVIECMLYTTMSYIVNFEGIMKQLNVLNPDAEIIMLGMIESMKGLTIRMEDGTFLPLGDIMDECVDFGNAYAAAYIAKMQNDQDITNTVYFAEAKEDIEMIYENYSTEVYRPENLVVRDRFFSSIDDQHERILDYLGMDVLGDSNANFCERNFDLNDVKGYEASGYDPNYDKYVNAYELYLGFEKAIVEAGKDGALTIDGLSLVYGDVDEIRKPGYAHVKDAMLDWQAGNTDKPLRDVVAEALLNNINTKSVMYQYCRCNVGNFLGNHPTAGGHKVLFDSIVEAYDAKYTPKDATIDNIIYYVSEYYDEAYAYAYKYAEKEGYIDEAVAGIDEAIEAVKAARTELENIESDMTDAFRGEALKEFDEIINTLEAAKELILEADMLDQATLDELLALLETAGEAMDQLGDTLDQAVVDVYELAVIPALEKAYEILIDEVLPQIDKQLQIAVKAGAEWLLDKLVEALPEIDKALYDWLYENPILVIGFFYYYGDALTPLLEEYGDEAGKLLCYVFINYGPDAVEYAIENPEEAIAKWVEWYNKHGHKVWPMIDKYIKTLDELGAFDEIKQAINDAAVELEAYVIAYAEKVVAELEAKINELNEAAQAALEELKAAIEAVDVDAILAALEELYNEGVAIYEGATTGYYAATEDSYYVALGDTNVEYAEIVADELDLDKDQFVNYGIEDMTAAELKAYLNAGDEDLIAEIENADLITLGFSNNTITKAAADALAAVMAGETVEFDWAPYVGKDGAAAMDKAIAAIEEALVAEGADADTIDMVVTVVEAYAFACTEFACNYPEAINAIKAINPETQVVVVGMYNPFENAVLDVEGTQIPVGEFVGALVDLANVHYTSYAILTGNAVYVHAPAVEIQAPFEETMDITGFASVLTDLDSLEPSAAGHEYIAQQILDAMNVVSKAVYDAQKLIDEIKAFGEVTRDNLADAKALAEAARQAWDKLTDEEKELIGLDNYKVLVDFELAVAKVELGVAEDIAAAEKALAEAEAKAAEIERALKITESTVANLKAKVVNKSQIKVTWEAAEVTPDQYRVTLMKAGKKAGTYWVAGDKETVTLKNVLRGANFTVRVTPVAKVDGKKYFSIYKTSNKVKTQLQKANLTVKKAGAKKQIISKDQNSTGFQIYISQDKKFKKNVKKLVYQTNKKGLNVKVKAKNFKKGTNYVKVRAYTKVNGKKVYGAWSGTVKVVK